MIPTLPNEYYGLISGLPVLSLDKPDLSGTSNLWRQYGRMLDSNDGLLLQAAYLQVDHQLLLDRFYERQAVRFEPLLACYTENEHQAFMQHQETIFPYQQFMLVPDKELSVRLLETSWRRVWNRYIRTLRNSLLARYADLQEALYIIRLLSEEDNGHTVDSSMRYPDDHEDVVSWQQYAAHAMEGTGQIDELKRLVTIKHPEEQELAADHLLWQWLDQQLFQKEFKVERLIVYAWQQQLVSRWATLRNADSAVPDLQIDKNMFQ